MPDKPAYRYYVEILDLQGGSPHLEYRGPSLNAARAAIRRAQNRNRPMAAYKVNIDTGTKTPLTL